ncbi:MAG: restriction endonuclease subunit S [Betaproteobacteria bacterium]|nr:restriction endonuclease subunit S [Betaproteobacteria bacterium]
MKHMSKAETELGLLPNGWAVERLDALFSVQQGKQVSKQNRLGDRQRPFLRTKNVFWGRLDLVELDEMHFTEAEERRLALQVGDLLICEGGNIGRTAIWQNNIAQCYYQNHLHRARFRDAAKTDPNFVLYWLWYAFKIGSIYFGRGNVTTIPNLSQSKLCELPILVPPLTEQRKIASVLGLVQQAMEQQKRLLTLTTELKKTLLNQLFTHGLRNEPQKQTEIGFVPESWEVTTLGQLACEPYGFIQTGPFGSQLHKHDYVDIGIGVINPTHLYENRINHANVPKVTISTATRLKRHLLEYGDILFARRGEIGRHGMVTEKEHGWLCGTGCFLVRVNHPDIDNRFLSYLFSIPGIVAWLNSHAAGAIMPNLNNTVLRSLPVFYPTKEIQVEIANALDIVSHKIEFHHRKYTALTALFRTMLHELMTAKIRVNKLSFDGYLEHAER